MNSYAHFGILLAFDEHKALNDITLLTFITSRYFDFGNTFTHLIVEAINQCVLHGRRTVLAYNTV